MQSAPSVLPTAPANDLTCGIDWARDDHAVSVVDATGREVSRYTVEHTVTGLAGLLRRLDQIGVGEVAHWCTLFVSVVPDESPMHPRCRRVTALLA